MKVQGSKTRKAAPAAECKEIGNQKGSLLLEAIVVLGMIATFTPMLYKHVADRRADIENINRANTLLYLQHKAEDYLKDPDNITALVTELGHNQHKEIYPSEMGAGSNFDGRYIVGIRREDENNKPVLKAMIIDTVHTGSDLRAAKVAELIGISAGIYTAVDPDAAWGINGIWSEPLSRYFDTTNIPTGAVAITTEYNKAKYRVNISDILVDADLDMGEFEVTAEQINAVAIAAQNGTLDQLIAQDVRASNKVVAGKKLCVGGEEDENCIESWEGLGGKDDSDLRLVQECNAGMTESCMGAFVRDLNTSCSKVDEVYDRFGAAYPSPKIYNLTYGSGTQYTGTVRTKCEGTQFVVDNISTATLTNPVKQVGDSAFGITTPGWYQITLMGEAGLWQGDHYQNNGGSGGILISNHQYSGDEIITIKAIKAGYYSSSPTSTVAGAGVALWDTIDTTSAPILVAGGGGSGSASGGGYNGGATPWSGAVAAYSWDGTTGTNTTYCNSATCNIGATGGIWIPSISNASSVIGYGGTGYCKSSYTCITVTGGNCNACNTNYPASTYGNWGTNTLTGGYGYASIRWCGPSGSASTCPDTCSTDSDCDSDMSCRNGFCSDIPRDGTVMYDVKNISTATLSSPVQEVGTYTIPVAGKYQIRLMGEVGRWGDSKGVRRTMNAGGILITNTYYNADTLITLKGIKGGQYSKAENWAGAGMALWDTMDTTSVPKLVAGGGGGNWGSGGGGYNGGRGYYLGDRNGYSWDGSQGNNTTYCDGTTNCGVAHGGSAGVYDSGETIYGGTGYCNVDYVCINTTGGNSMNIDYRQDVYGNWSATPGEAKASATIVYCGPNANSACPEACGNNVVCTTGTCNYHTGLCE